MDMMEVWHGAAIGQPHPVTLSGGLVHFQTDMDGLMQITGSGTVISCGSNLIDDSKRYVSTTSVYIGHTNTGYAIPLKAGAYRFTCEYLDGAHSNAYIREQNASSAYRIWANSDPVSSATFTLAADGIYRINLYLDSGIAANKVGRCWLVCGDTDTEYAAYTGTISDTLTGRKSLVGINNVFSDSGNITVTYWTH